LGLDGDEAFPAVVGRQLAAEGLPVRVVNAGVSGDTSAGGVSRMDWILRQSPDIVVVGLGANDGLRGLDLDPLEQNLRRIITRARAAGADVLLLGMQMPPSHGPAYAERFRDVYPRLARELSVPLVPFLLEGVGGEQSLNQADGIHPDAEGQRILAGNVLPHLRPLVQERAAKAAKDAR
jgi:acyl-CoA thioesterase-1